MTHNLGRPLWAVGLLSLALVMFLAVGCGEEALLATDFPGYTSSSEEMSIDLTQEDGGMAPTAESPGFGEEYFSRYLGEEEPVYDPLERDPRMSQLERRGASVQYLRVTWGNLRRGPEAADADSSGPFIDWTGGATVSDGLLLPLRVIRFERNDHLVRPELDAAANRQTVRWISHTGPAWDGVLLKIVVPPARDTSFVSNRPGDAGDGLTPDDVFTFETAPLQIRFPLANLAELDTVIMVDDVNGVTFTGFDPSDVNRCPRGPMVGAWVKVDGDSLNGGFFRAKWVDPRGHFVGHLRGRWGVLADGKQVFVGKIINRHGRYLGHVRGFWDTSPEDPGRGRFHGSWFRENPQGDRVQLGYVKGAWAVNEHIDDGGLMRGVWGRYCGHPDTEGDS